MLLGAASLVTCILLGAGAYMYLLVRSAPVDTEVVDEQPRALLDRGRLEKVLAAYQAESGAFESLRTTPQQAPDVGMRPRPVATPDAIVSTTTDVSP
jgi:hypothetical protein